MTEIDPSNDWSVKYRPTSMAEFAAPDYIALHVETMLTKPPNSILIDGEFGNGKTTLARIIANSMTAHASDIMELNAASDTGIDNIRNIVKTSAFRPKGKRRVFIVDEAHGLSYQAINALLKPVEEPPGPVTWIFCSSESGKINRALITRARRITLPAPDKKAVRARLVDIAAKEGIAKYTALANADKTERKELIAAMATLASRAQGFRSAVNNFQTLADVVASMKKSNFKAVLDAVKATGDTMKAFGDTSGVDLIKLVNTDMLAAASQLLRSRGVDTFNQIYFAARDSIQDGHKSAKAAMLLRWCLEALQWGANTNSDPAVHHASKLASKTLETK